MNAREVTSDVRATAAGRVVAVHRATRQGLAVALGFALAAVLAAVLPHDTGWWLPLHLFLVGALLSAISAVTQLLAVTWSSSPAPPARVAAGQRWVLAAGTVALAAGRELDLTWLVGAGGAAVVAAVAGMVPIMLWIRQGAATDRFHPATDAYVVAFLLGSIGTTMAVLLATGRADDRWIEVRDAHLTINLFGLVGVVVAATLPFFAATQARSRMSPRATPVVVRTLTLVLAASAAVAAGGRLADRPAVGGVALVVYALGVAAIVPLLPVFGRRALVWAGPRLVQLLAGVAWWAAATFVLGVLVARGASVEDERVVLRVLAVGGFGQLLVASLAYLGPVLRGGGHERLSAGFAITRSWVSLVAGNAAAVALLLDVRTVALAAVVVWALDLAWRAARLVRPGTSASVAAGADAR